MEPRQPLGQGEEPPAPGNGSGDAGLPANVGHEVRLTGLGVPVPDLVASVRLCPDPTFLR